VAVSREHILSEIRRAARDNGGKPVGRTRFATLTGIKEADVIHYWARWGDAVADAGFTPNVMEAKRESDAMFAVIVADIRSNGRFPTRTELRLRKKDNPAYPGEGVLQRYGQQGLAEKVAAFVRDRPEDADVLAILEPLLARKPSAKAQAPVKPVVFGHVYLMKSGKYHKIGRSNSAGRREYEVALQLPEPVKLMHTIKTDDPPGIEAYWHHRFRERRVRGEWFRLTADDITAFMRRSFM
jgi:hypothetical protein